MAHAKSDGQLVNSNDGGVTSAGFKSAEILLRKPRPLGNLLLGQSTLQPQASKVTANEAPHVHR